MKPLITIIILIAIISFHQFVPYKAVWVEGDSPSVMEQEIYNNYKLRKFMGSYYIEKQWEEKQLMEGLGYRHSVWKFEAKEPETIDFIYNILNNK